jgi:predicted lipid-binding transport protein (Tim44 family)
MLALSAVALLAGCGTGTSNSTNSTTNSTNSTTNAGANASPTAAQASPTSTPITSNAGSTPTETFKAYYEAIKAKDAEAVKRLFSKETMKMLEEQAKQSNKTVDEVFKEGMEDASKEVPATMPEVRNEKIDGDTATIEIKDDKTDKWETFHLVKEDGQWKISFGK